MNLLILFINHILASDDRFLTLELEKAGEIWGELDRVLVENGNWGTKCLSWHANQFNLANLTSGEVLDDITYARKGRGSAYLAGTLSEQLWRNWVLPHRVLEEDPCLWRKVFYEALQEVVEGKTTTKEVADAVLDWMWEIDENGVSRVEFTREVVEGRQKTPLQVLESGKGACRELNMLYVYLLRSVGIPARHCTVGWWYHTNDRHFYCEYWDPQLNKWESWDASSRKSPRFRSPTERYETGVWSSLAMYAYPSYSGGVDIYGTNQFSLCENVTSHIAPIRTETLQLPTVSGETAGETVMRTSVWNNQTWRPIIEARTDQARYDLTLGDAGERQYPILQSAKHGSHFHLAIHEPGEALGDLEWVELKDGETIEWQVGEKKKGATEK